MPSCPKGGIHLVPGFLVFLVFWFAGCSSIVQGGKPYQGEPPLSNIHVGELVLEHALENAAIPCGNGTEIVYRVSGDSAASELLQIIAQEFLLNHDYRIIQNSKIIPEIRFHLDTLYVNLAKERSGGMGKVVRRYSEARIGAVLRETSGVKKVYRGSAVHEDTFPFQVLDSVGCDETFATILTSYNRVKVNIKPLVFGITMTALAWFLYSYRG